MPRRSRRRAISLHPFMTCAPFCSASRQITNVQFMKKIRKKIPDFRTSGTFVPWQTFTRDEAALTQRDMTATGAGSSFLQTFREPEIADALRPLSAVASSGCTILELSRDNISIPRWASPSNPAAYPETTIATNNGQTVSLLTLTAHRVGSLSIISRQLLLQDSDMQLETLVL
jgi:HK97 family phage major capsid protein